MSVPECCVHACNLFALVCHTLPLSVNLAPLPVTLSLPFNTALLSVTLCPCLYNTVSCPVSCRVLACNAVLLTVTQCPRLEC